MYEASYSWFFKIKDIFTESKIILFAKYPHHIEEEKKRQDDHINYSGVKFIYPNLKNDGGFKTYYWETLKCGERHCRWRLFEYEFPDKNASDKVFFSMIKLLPILII